MHFPSVLIPTRGHTCVTETQATKREQLSRGDEEIEKSSRECGSFRGLALAVSLDEKTSADGVQGDRREDNLTSGHRTCLYGH